MYYTLCCAFFQGFNLLLIIIGFALFVAFSTVLCYNCRAFDINSTVGREMRKRSKMNSLKQTIADNIISLRKSQKLTQADLAQKLNYSDKAISKWERAESIPDVIILKQIADLFKVSVDYLLTSHNSLVSIKSEKQNGKKIKDENKISITLLSVYPVWIVATVVFLLIGFLSGHYFWQIFIMAIPVSAIILIIFNTIWGKRIINFVIISVLVWGILASIYFWLFKYNLWQLGILGILGEVVIITWARIKK